MRAHAADLALLPGAVALRRWEQRQLAVADGTADDDITVMGEGESPWASGVSVLCVLAHGRPLFAEQCHYHALCDALSACTATPPPAPPPAGADPWACFPRGLSLLEALHAELRRASVVLHPTSCDATCALFAAAAKPWLSWLRRAAFAGLTSDSHGEFSRPLPAPPADGGPAIELFAPAFAAEVREIVRDAAHSIALLRASAHFDLRLPAGPADARAARAAAVPDGDGDVCEGLPRLWLVWGVHQLAGVRRYWAGTHAELRASCTLPKWLSTRMRRRRDARRRRRQSDGAPRSALRSRRPTRRWRRGWRRSVS